MLLNLYKLVTLEATDRHKQQNHSFAIGFEPNSPMLSSAPSKYFFIGLTATGNQTSARAMAIWTRSSEADIRGKVRLEALLCMLFS